MCGGVILNNAQLACAERTESGDSSSFLLRTGSPRGSENLTETSTDAARGRERWAAGETGALSSGRRWLLYS